MTPLLSPVIVPPRVARLAVPLIATIALLLGLVSPARAAGSTVSGTVVADASGAGVADAWVTLEKRRQNGSEVEWIYEASELTASNGTYSMEGISAGTYRVTADEETWDSARVGYLRTSSAAFVVGTSGATAPDVRLPIGGKITGTVARAGGTPGATFVSAYQERENRWLAVSSTSADPVTGAYALVGLETGVYRLVFADGRYPATHVSQAWPNQPTVERGQSFTVTRGQTTADKNATLALGGSITGTVTADGSGKSLSLIQVTAYAQRTSSTGATRWAEVSSSYTDADGQYSVPGLTTGAYHLRFRDQDSGAPGGRPLYDTEFYQDKTTQEASNQINVTLGAESSGTNASLGLRGSISGTISTAEGTPLAGGTVKVYAYEEYYYDDVDEVGGYWREVGTTSADSTGVYELVGVTSGARRVQFTDPKGDYLREFFRDASTVQTANDVGVSPGRATTDVNATLARAGSISGIVTAGGGTTPTACVFVYRKVTQDGVARFRRVYDVRQTTGAGGSYTVKGLEPGTYTLRFDDCGGDGLLRQYWGNVRRVADATGFDVPAGQPVTGKDVTMIKGASISGTVTGSGTTSIDRRVAVVDAASGTVVRTTSIDDDGTYSITGLTPGSYKVEFARLSGLATSAASFFENIAEQLGLTSAKPISLPSGGDKANVNATLAAGGHITGRLVNASGQPLSGFQMHAYTDDRTLVTRAAVTDADGVFDIAGLTTGSYKVVANLGGRGALKPGYFTGPAELAESSVAATPVAVTVGSVRALSGNVVLGATPPPVVGPPSPPPSVPSGPSAPPAIVKVASSIKVSAKGAKKKATLTVTVRAAGVTPTGKITIKLGSKTLKTVTLRNGRAKVVLKKQKKGKRSYKIVYGGDSRVKNKTAVTKKVTVK